MKNLLSFGFKPCYKREADIYHHYNTDHAVIGGNYFFPGVLAEKYEPAEPGTDKTKN
jgi:hypothetical protein